MERVLDAAIILGVGYCLWQMFAPRVSRRMQRSVSVLPNKGWPPASAGDHAYWAPYAAKAACN